MNVQRLRSHFGSKLQQSPRPRIAARARPSCAPHLGAAGCKAEPVDVKSEPEEDEKPEEPVDVKSKSESEDVDEEVSESEPWTERTRGCDANPIFAGSIFVPALQRHGVGGHRARCRSHRGAAAAAATTATAAADAYDAEGRRDASGKGPSREGCEGR